LLATYKDQVVTHATLNPLQIFQSKVDIFLAMGLTVQLFFDLLEEAFSTGNGVTDLMGNCGGKLTNGSELFPVLHLAFQDNFALDQIKVVDSHSQLPTDRFDQRSLLAQEWSAGPFLS